MLQTYIAQAAVAAVSILLAAVLLIVGAGFFAASAYFAFCLVLKPPLAALVTGLAALLVACASFLLGQLARKMLGRSRRRRLAARAPESTRGLAAALGGLAGEELAALARSHVGGTLAASLVAGFAFGASPSLRRLLRDLAAI